MKSLDVEWIKSLWKHESYIHLKIFNNNSFITKNCYNCLESLITIHLIKNTLKKETYQWIKSEVEVIKKMHSWMLTTGLMLHGQSVFTENVSNSVPVINNSSGLQNAS